MEIKKIINKREEGFALLITIIVIGVILSVGITILELSIKQVRLSTNARESEVSFHAANAGAECARHWRQVESSSMVIGGNISPTCFGVDPKGGNPVSSIDVSSLPNFDGTGGEVFRYEYKFQWGDDTRCTEIDTIVAVAALGGSGITISDMKDLIPGFPSSSGYPKGISTCDPGSQCTILSVKGYNQPCSDSVYAYGTVQREVLLQF